MKKIIFEGAELAGKSWIMSQVYEYLEPKYNSAGNIFDGCHWFNSDNGVFGTSPSRGVIEGYLQIFEALREKSIIVEKFTLSDEIYQKLHNNLDYDYSRVNHRLVELGFKIVLITFPEDKEKLQARIQDRLNLYPHYERILHPIDWYQKQQAMYRERIEKQGLPYLIADTDILPDDNLVKEIIAWIDEK